MTRPGYHKKLSPERKARVNRQIKEAKWRRRLQLLAPEAISLAYFPGFIPEFLKSFSNLEGAERWIDEINARHFFTMRTAASDLQVTEGPPGIIPKLPVKVRGPTRGTRYHPDALRYGDYLPGTLHRLANGHVISITMLNRAFQAGVDRYMYAVQHKRNMPAANGEWGLLYGEEVHPSFPTICFSNPRRAARQNYMINVIRDTSGVVSELRVYGLLFSALFTMPVALHANTRVPPDAVNWWMGRTRYLAEHGPGPAIQNQKQPTLTSTPNHTHNGS